MGPLQDHHIREIYINIYGCVCPPPNDQIWFKSTHFGSNLPILAQICPFWLKFVNFWLKFVHFFEIELAVGQRKSSI